MIVERTANIAFLALLLIPVALFFAFQNLLLFREYNLRRRYKPPAASPKPGGKVRVLHTRRPRSKDPHKALFR